MKSNGLCMSKVYQDIDKAKFILEKGPENRFARATCGVHLYRATVGMALIELGVSGSKGEYSDVEVIVASEKKGVPEGVLDNLEEILSWKDSKRFGNSKDIDKYLLIEVLVACRYWYMGLMRKGY